MSAATALVRNAMKNEKVKQVRKLNINKLFAKYPQLATGGIFAVVVIVFSILSPVFLSSSNLANILESTAAISIAAFGMTLILLAGGIDLSVGAIVALIGVASAILLEDVGFSIITVVIISLLIGISVGFINGVIITTWGVQPFLVTLGMMTIVRGSALIVSGGRSTYVTNELFKKIFAKGDLFGIPVLILWTVIILIILYVLVGNTAYGRRIQSIGGNESAAINSGIKVKQIKIIAYIINGALAAICGMIILGKLSSGLPNSGEGLEMEAIAAAVLGGTGLKGEGGNMIGTLLGALVIGVVINGLTLMGVHAYIQTVVKGMIIIITVVGSISLTRQRDV